MLGREMFRRINSERIKKIGWKGENDGINWKDY